MLQIILCLMCQAQISESESLKVAPPNPILVSVMNYKGNEIVYAKSSNAVTIFSQHVLFYAIDNPEFAQYLMNAGITTFVMADGSTINIETLKRSSTSRDLAKTIIFLLLCGMVGFSLSKVVHNDTRVSELKEVVKRIIEKVEK